MIRISLLCIYAIVFSFSTPAQWNLINPTTTDKDLYSIYSVDNKHWSVGEEGTIVFSSNDGLTWTNQISNVSENLNSVFFVNTSLGFTVGDNGTILRTSNGGNDWNIIPTTTDYNLSSVFFVNEDTGWTAGGIQIGMNSYSVTLKTTDGGLNWVEQDNTSQYIYSIFFLNENIGWSLGYNYQFNGSRIKRTTNGGLTWEEKSLGISGHFRDINFINEDIGYCVGDEVIKTTNGGDSWELVNGDFPYTTKVKFLNENLGWIMSGRLLFSTTDGGSNWIEHSLPEFKSRFRNYTSYRSLSLTDVGEIYIAGGDGTIIKSDDLGQSWSILSGILNEMFSVQFLDSINGFLATSNGYIYKTNDGGQSWTVPTNSPTTRDVLNLNFINNQIGFATTDNEILKTTNGGTFWIKENYTPNHQYLTLNDIFFVDSMNGWAGGTYRTITHSNDGGVNWQVQLEDNGVVEIKSIYFFNENKGYAVAVAPGTNNWEYLIYKTTDGGNSWSTDSLKIEGYFGGKIEFINENEGWLLLDDRLLYSSDSGNSWDLKFFVNDMVSGQDLSVVNQNKLWITTIDGAILNSTNMGETWGIQKKYDDYSHNLRSIDMFNDQLGWVVGSPDIIYKTDNGGQGQINFPSVPDLLYPLDSSLVVEEGFLFEWIGANDCFSRFQISTDGEFNNILFEGYYINNSINSNWIIELENNKKYYWRVQSENQIGTSDWSPVWYFTTDIHPVLDVKKDNKINQFKLQQNYPNPFNPFTKIKYEIPEIGKVTIKVFDILGREILTLVNEIKPAGEYEVEFDGSKLSSGIYFYQIKADTFVETKKMVLLK